MSALTFTVYGTPAPQGSKRHVGNGVMVESSAKVKPWRQDVKHAALEAIEAKGWHADRDTALFVELVFWLARPKGHYGTGKNAGVVKASAPGRPTGRPDVDKLARSTLDALGEAGVWHDDAQVATLLAKKFYTTGPSSAVIIVARARADR